MVPAWGAVRQAGAPADCDPAAPAPLAITTAAFAYEPDEDGAYYQHVAAGDGWHTYTVTVANNGSHPLRNIELSGGSWQELHDPMDPVNNPAHLSYQARTRGGWRTLPNSVQGTPRAGVFPGAVTTIAELPPGGAQHLRFRYRVLAHTPDEDVYNGVLAVYADYAVPTGPGKGPFPCRERQTAAWGFKVDGYASPDPARLPGTWRHRVSLALGGAAALVLLLATGAWALAWRRRVRRRRS